MTLPCTPPPPRTLLDSAECASPTNGRDASRVFRSHSHAIVEHKHSRRGAPDVAAGLAAWPLRAARRARTTAARAGGACVIRSDGDAQRSLHAAASSSSLLERSISKLHSCRSAAGTHACRDSARTAAARRLASCPSAARGPRRAFSAPAARHIEAPTFYASLLAERLHTHASSERGVIPVRLRRHQRFQSGCMALRP